MSEKAKQKHDFNRRRRYWIGVIPLVFALIIAGGFLFPVFPDDSSLKSSLDPGYLPVAEHLLQHPQPESEYVKLNFIDSFRGNGEIWLCVELYSPDGRAEAMRNATEIELNKSSARLSGFASTLVGIVFENGLTRQDYHTNRCLFGDNPLLPGIHLLEVRLKYSPHEEPFHVHQWAFEFTR